MSELRQAPYPTDTRAKGWRFELDMERAHQSDTWTLAPAEVRPWLLMIWATAWEQTPCGSLPDDDALIAARLGMPPKLWAKHRAILLRKWWKADDGRLYHDVLVQRVMEMMERRRKESDRKALARARKAADVHPDSASVPRDNQGTTVGFHPQGDTGTRTGTGTSTGEILTPVATPTAAGRVCGVMRKSGLSDANPGHPTLLALLAAGTTDEEFQHATAESVSRGKGFAYALGVLTRQRDAAAALALQSGPLPAAESPWERSQREQVERMTGGIVSKRAPNDKAKEVIDGCVKPIRAALG